MDEHLLSRQPAPNSGPVDADDVMTIVVVRDRVLVSIGGIAR